MIHDDQHLLMMMPTFGRRGAAKLDFPRHPKICQKMDIIEDYLLGGPIFNKKYKCYTILESFHDCLSEDDAKLGQSGQENKC